MLRLIQPTYLVAIFLELIGFSSAQFCDGPYDGGKDFYIDENKVGGLKIAFQISTESDWRKKLKKDAAKVNREFETNLLYFISSRRIPESSFEEVKTEILISHSTLRQK